MTIKEMVRYYALLLALLFVTMWGGITLIYQQHNVIDRLTIFDNPKMGWLIGSLMIIFPIVKIVAVYMNEQTHSRVWQFLKKWSLIGVAVIWLVIAWAYAVNATTNMGYVTATFPSIVAYIELWRGRFE